MKNLSPTERGRHPGEERVVAKMKGWLNTGRLNKEVNILRIMGARFLSEKNITNMKKGKT